MKGDSMLEISIIVPVYKVERYLGRCVSSILKQTFTDFELILVDDGSPDNCGKMCDEYAQKDNRITVIHKENGGLSDARNAGLEIAKGKYVAFVDSDDWIHPQMYEILYKAIKSGDYDFSQCGFSQPNIKNLDADIEYNDIEYKEYCDINVKEFTAEYFLDNFRDFDFLEVQWNKLFKAKIFENLRFPVGKIFEDSFVILDELSVCKNIAFVPYELYYYYSRSDSITLNAKDYIKNFKELDIAIYYSEFFEKHGNLEYSKLYRFDFFWYFLKVYYSSLKVKGIGKCRKKYLNKYRALLSKQVDFSGLNWAQKSILLLAKIHPRIAYPIYMYSKY